MSAALADPPRSSRNTPETGTVHIVDGDTTTRSALDSLVRFAGWQTRTAASAEHFLALPRAVEPGCVLVNLNLPGRSGLELQQLILDRSEMQVIFMSGNANIRDTVQAMKAGAFEFLTRPFPDEVLLGTIRQAIECSCAEVRRLEHIRVLQERHQSLSRREREVMALVIAGRLNKQVAAELSISEITVKAHRGRVMRKMKARSLPELVNMGTQLHQRAPGDAAAMRDDSPSRVDHAVSSYRVTPWRQHSSPAWLQFSFGAS